MVSCDTCKLLSHSEKAYILTVPLTLVLGITNCSYAWERLHSGKKIIILCPTKIFNCESQWSLMSAISGHLLMNSAFFFRALQISPRLQWVYFILVDAFMEVKISELAVLSIHLFSIPLFDSPSGEGPKYVSSHEKTCYCFTHQEANLSEIIILFNFCVSVLVRRLMDSQIVVIRLLQRNLLVLHPRRNLLL